MSLTKEQKALKERLLTCFEQAAERIAELSVTAAIDETSQEVDRKKRANILTATELLALLKKDGITQVIDAYKEGSFTLDQAIEKRIQDGIVTDISVDLWNIGEEQKIADGARFQIFAQFKEDLDKPIPN